jgi:hypothetical protein
MLLSLTHQLREAQQRLATLEKGAIDKARFEQAAKNALAPKNK